MEKPKIFYWYKSERGGLWRCPYKSRGVYYGEFIGVSNNKNLCPYPHTRHGKYFLRVV